LKIYLTTTTTTTWIREQEDQLCNINDMPYTEIMQEDIVHVTKNAHSWKATGIDNLHSYWFKQFTCSHSLLAKHFNYFVKEPQNIPNFFTQGITYMKPKDSDTANPLKYRPVTCLLTVYKILTACIVSKIYTHCENNKIVAEEQKGCRKLSQGCKEHLIIDSMVTEQAKHKKYN
jgi:hypothetical protein